jgi:hypothetical protein
MNSECGSPRPAEISASRAIGEMCKVKIRPPFRNPKPICMPDTTHSRDEGLLSVFRRQRNRTFLPQQDGLTRHALLRGKLEGEDLGNTRLHADPYFSPPECVIRATRP